MALATVNTPAQVVPAKRLVYITDPMCSWCWGFSPVFESLVDAIEDRLPVVVMLGGLRPGTTQPQTASEKAAQQQHWRNVQRASGQPFDFAFFDRPSFVYDTEPAARAVVVARMKEASRTGRFLAAVQAALYRDNRDVTDEAILVDIATSCGFEPSAFADTLRSEAARAQTRAEFATVRRLAIAGFPTVLGQDGDQLIALVTGFRPWKMVKPAIEHWIALGG